MAETFLKRGKDNLTNGAVLGGLTGALIVYGQDVYDWIVPMIPDGWMIMGDHSTTIILIGLGALIGYVVDRN